MLFQPVGHPGAKRVSHLHEIARLALRDRWASFVLRCVSPVVAFHQRDRGGFVGAAAVLENLEHHGAMTLSLHRPVPVRSQHGQGERERRRIRQPEPAAGAERGRAAVAQRFLRDREEALDLVLRGRLSV